MKRAFAYRALDELRRDAERHAPSLDFAEGIAALAAAVPIGGRTAWNAFAVHPMEGCDATADGAPGELTERRWLRFAEGGAALLWGEATAVTPDGRANPRQLWLHDGTVDAFARLLERCRRAHRAAFGRDAVIGIQLTHSGRYSFPRALPAVRDPLLDPITVADKRTHRLLRLEDPLLSDDDLARIADAYVEATRLAVRAGFDFVDVKQCHGYLLNELLGARSRPGPYGGSFGNRTRFVRELLRRIRGEHGERLLLAARIGCYDGVPFARGDDGRGAPATVPPGRMDGFGVDLHDPTREDTSEPLALAALLADEGVRLLNVTLGNPYTNPHIGRPYERPASDGYEPPEHPLAGVERHVRIAEAVHRHVPACAVVGTGYSWLQRYFPHVAEANVAAGRVSMVGLGRGAIAYPEFAREALERGVLASKRVCLTASFCTDLMRAKHNREGQFPSGCVPRDHVYAGIYREAQRLAGPARTTVTRENSG